MEKLRVDNVIDDQQIFITRAKFVDMSTDSNSLPASNVQLRVFHQDTDHEQRGAIHQQLPLIDELANRFELVTGWKIDFVESLASFQKRVQTDVDQSATGKLEITDLSDQLEVGNTARHRGYCDQLVETLEAMVATIQLDRQRFRDWATNLNPVVQPPFEWWGLAGKSGVRRGRVSNWSVSSAEMIQLYFADIDGDEDQQLALAATALFATFETASQLTGNIFDYAPQFPSIIAKTCSSQQRLKSFGTFEIDPITGEYQLDGFNAADGYVIIDVDAAAVIRPGLEETDGVLYSGQIMGVGIDDEQATELIEAIDGQEMTVGQCLSICENLMENSAALFLYRK